MKKYIIQIILHILVFSIGFYYCDRKIFFYGTSGLIPPLYINIHQLPFDIQPSLFIDEWDIVEYKRYFYLNNYSYSNPNTDPGIYSYFYNKSKKILVYTYLDSCFNKHYYKAYMRNSGYFYYQEISEQDMITLKKQKTRVVDNLFSNGTFYEMIQGYLFVYLIMGIIITFATLNFSSSEVGMRTRKIFKILSLLILFLLASSVIYFDIKSSKYGKSRYFNIESKKYDMHILSSEILRRDSISDDGIRSLLSIQNRDDMDIISEGDTLFWSKPYKIKKFISYCRNDQSLLFSFTTYNNPHQVLYAMIEDNNGVINIEEITNKEWTKISEDNKCYIDFELFRYLLFREAFEQLFIAAFLIIMIITISVGIRI